MSHPYAGPDPYDLDGVRTLCRGCHIERHRPDDMTPGRAACCNLQRRQTCAVIVFRVIPKMLCLLC